MPDQKNSPFRVPHKSIRAFAGRMTLHKDTEPQTISGRLIPVRNEEMFYFLCFDWDELRTMLRDPVRYFQEILKLGDDSLVSPVTAIVNPVNWSLMYLPEKIRKLQHIDDVITTVAESESDSDISILDDGDKRSIRRPGPKEYINYKKGWFFAEFANRTHILTIYYKRPSKWHRNKMGAKYTKGYTVPTVCRIGNSKFGQAHFDLKLKHRELDQNDNFEFEQDLAHYVVDLIQDGGVQLCKELNAFDEIEVGDFRTIFNGNGTSTQATVPTKLKRESEFAMASKGKGALSMTIEGLSTTHGGLTLDGDYPTFACSIGSSYIHGRVYELEPGVMKRYIAPTQGGG
jgi:hypothetical protein